MGHLLIALLTSHLASAAPALRPQGPGDCGEMEVWDYTMAMCMPRAMAGMPMRMFMFQANVFAVQDITAGARGRDALAWPNWFMADLGSTLGDRNYVNLDLMGTAERWAYPRRGYPEFLQIGEVDQNGRPFLDAQHPHSSPIMGLTLSDTLSFGSGSEHARFWFAPRGSAAEGPVPFMHRPTGEVNPDAPLGHHIGQDVAHISSTVLGASARLRNSTLEVSTYHGAEPDPENVDLPMERPDSYSARFTEQFGANYYAMASAAYVRRPEREDPTLTHIWRYSASLYAHSGRSDGWSADQALIWGLVNGYDGVAALDSFAHEFVVRHQAHRLWGRLEVLQRTAAELEVPEHLDDNRPHWVTALTLGYTYALARTAGAEFAVGGSLSEDFLPSIFHRAYAGDPFTARLFIEWNGGGMWELGQH